MVDHSGSGWAEHKLLLFGSREILGMGGSDSFSILGDGSISFFTQDAHSAYKHIFGLENLKAT